MPTSYYVSPNLFFYDSDEKTDFFNKEISHLTYKQSIPLGKLEIDQPILLLGEPGFGKSRLLRKIFNQKCEEGLQGALIDLKLAKGGIQDYIIQQQESNSEEAGNNLFPVFTKEFSLNCSSDNRQILALDALDEVHSEKVYNILSEIRTLHEKHPNLIILLSCRIHHAFRYASILNKLKGFAIVQILKFSRWQIAEFIKHNSDQFNDDKINTVLKKLRPLIGAPFFEYRGPLATPRYLEYFLLMIEDRQLSSMTKITRSELFEFCIPRLLKRESKKEEDYRRKIPYLIQCFERLALFMEIQRVNAISKIDFASFEIDANLSMSNQLFLETIYDRTLLKDNDDYLEFDNTEIQEYLAACALKHLGSLNQIIFDVAIEKRIGLIYPGWINVLGYLIEQQPEFIVSLIEFGCRSNNPGVFNLLEFIPENELELKHKDQAFRQIFQYSILQKRWLRHGLSEYLAKLYDPDTHDGYLVEALSATFTHEDYYVVTFITEILTEYCTQRKKPLSSNVKEKWQDILMKYLEAGFEYGNVMHRSLIQFLPHICSIEDFEPYLDRYLDNPGTIFSAVVRFYSESDPNHPRSIQLFFQSAIIGSSLGYHFKEIKTEQGFVHFFEELGKRLKEPPGYKLLQRIDRILSPEVLSNLKSSLSPVLEDRILLYIKEVLEEGRFREEKVVSEIAATLQDWNNRFSLKLARIIIKDEALKPTTIAELGKLLGKIMPKEFVDEIEPDLLKHQMAERLFFWLGEYHPDPEIQKKHMQHFPDVGQVLAENQRKAILKKNTFEARQFNRHRQQYDWLIELLNKENYHFFSHYAAAADDIRNFFTPFQEKKIESLVFQFLKEYSPFDVALSTSENNGQKTITYTAVLEAFQGSLKLISLKDYTLEKDRQKILAALLFNWDTEVTNILLGRLKPITTDDFEFISSGFLAQSEDFQLETVSHLIDVCEETDIDISSLYPFFEKIAYSSKYRNHLRLAAIRFLNKHRPSLEFLNKIFEQVQKEASSDETMKLMREINRYQLACNEQPAVEWRINHVLENRYILKSRNHSGFRMRAVGDKEDLGVPLGTVTSEDVMLLMLKTLRESFEIVLGDQDYFEYVSNELWEPITNYFLGIDLSPSKHADIINELEKLIGQYQERHPIHYYKSRIDKIKRKYVELFSKPMAVGESTKLYLKMRSTRYLDLAHPEDVFNVVTDTIRNEFTNWVRQGYYQFVGTIQSYKGGKVRREELIQQTMVTQLEAFLLRRGLRSTDVENSPPIIYREVQLLDGKRADLVVSYGLVGSVMIEVKRMGNQDLMKKNQEDYRDVTFLPYMRQTHCQFGIFVVFLDRENERKNFSTTLLRLDKLYSSFPNVKIIGIDCLPTEESQKKS